MERRIEQFLPYFSIGINILLCWSMLDQAAKTVVYSNKYASAILRLIDLALL